MLSDTITVASTKNTVAQDPAVDVDYTRWDDQTPNKSTYISDSHELSARDMLTFNRTFPKPSGNFLGMQKCLMKFTKDISVPGVDGVDILAPSIVQLAYSLPCGVTEDQLIFLKSRIAALALNWTVTAAVARQLTV